MMTYGGTHPSFLHWGSFFLYPKEDLNSVEKQTWFLLLVHVHKRRSKLAELNFLLKASPSLGNFLCVHLCRKVETLLL